MNLERKRKMECLNSSCPYVKGKCIIYNGKECSRLGGKRIPTQRIVYESEDVVAQNSHAMRPYFIVDGWVMSDEGR